MTVNEKVLGALSQFGIPARPDFYGGPEEEYFTFNYADERAVDFGDDAPLHAVAYMQVHWFLPLDRDYLERKKAVRNALFRAGFTYPEVTVLAERTGTGKGIRHVVFECETEDEEALLDDDDWQHADLHPAHGEWEDAPLTLKS